MNKLERQGILELVALGKSLSNGLYDHANLAEANLRGADLQGANLSYANLSKADLRGAHLHGANLCRANLSGACLSRADLCQANLEKADLSYSDLSRANFEGAKLVAADLREAYLEGANLKEANLIWADLSRANLRRSDLSGADLRYSRFGEVELTGAICDGIKVYGSTVYASRSFGVSCSSLDISQAGDGSVAWLDEPSEFFGGDHHDIRLEVRAPLDHQINAILGILYLQLAQRHEHLRLRPPLIESRTRRTHITFSVERSVSIGEYARVVCLPFAQASSIDWQELSRVCGDVPARPEAVPVVETGEQRLDLFLESAGHLFGSSQLPPFFGAEVLLEIFWGETQRAMRAGAGTPIQWSEPDPWGWMMRRSLG